MENVPSDKIELSYSTLWKSIIRPPRDTYSQELLGDEIFNYRGTTYLRKDYELLNNRGEILKCSFVEPTEETRVIIIIKIKLK